MSERIKSNLGVIVAAIIIVAGAAFLAIGFATTKPPQATAGKSLPVATPRPQEAQPVAATGSASEKGNTRTNEGGAVTVDVTWQNPGNTGPLAFQVAMDTHSVNLDNYDLSKLAVLRNDRREEEAPTAWDAPPGGGHHRSGTLRFAGSVLGPDTKVVELVIRDIAGVKVRVLAWEVAK